MALPVNFWATGWEDILCLPTFDPANISVVISNNLTKITLTNLENVVYAGGLYNLGATAREAGLLFGREVSDPDNVLVFQYGAILNYIPHSPPASTNFYTSRGRYAPIFIGMNEALGGAPATAGAGAILTETPEGTTDFDLFHWQPLAAAGTIAEVLGALLMFVGADPDTDIDQDSFSDAYDDMLDGRPDIENQPFVWFRAVEGESVGDSLKKIVSHCSDFLTINLAGKVALISRRVNRSSSVPITPGTVIGDVILDTSLGRMTNTADISHGQWCDVGGWNTRVGGYDPDFNNDANLLYFSGTNSVAGVEVYGTRDMGKVKRKIMIRGKEETRSTAACPYFYYSQQKEILISRVEDNESKRSTMLTVVQGLLGLDYGVGYEIDTVEVDPMEGGDSYRCVHKSIDFNNLTVTSKILREYVDSAP